MALRAYNHRQAGPQTDRSLSDQSRTIGRRIPKQNNHFLTSTDGSSGLEPSTGGSQNRSVDDTVPQEPFHVAILSEPGRSQNMPGSDHIPKNILTLSLYYRPYSYNSTHTNREPTIKCCSLSIRLWYGCHKVTVLRICDVTLAMKLVGHGGTAACCGSRFLILENCFNYFLTRSIISITRLKILCDF